MVPKSKSSRKGTPVSSLILGSAFVLLVGAVAAALIFQNARMIIKRTELAGTIAELERRAIQLEGREAELQAAVAENQGEDFQEKILRERGLYQKPGEQVLTILPSSAQENAEDEQEERVWWNPLTW